MPIRSNHIKNPYFIRNILGLSVNLIQIPFVGQHWIYLTSPFSTFRSWWRGSYHVLLMMAVDPFQIRYQVLKGNNGQLFPGVLYLPRGNTVPQALQTIYPDSRSVIHLSPILHVKQSKFFILNLIIILIYANEIVKLV